MTRTGPTPLPLHLGIAASASMGGDKAGAALLTDMAAGIRKYQTHSYERTLATPETVWSAGMVRLLLERAREGGAKQPALLLVPSLINGSEIFDLIEGRSLMRWMAGQGRDVYLLDWGASVEDPGQGDMHRLVTQRLLPAIEAAALRSGGPVDVLGYCMGGTIVAAAAYIAPDNIRKAVFMATPWDFHAPDSMLRDHVSQWMPAAAMLMARDGRLPAYWVQSVFAALDPQQAIRKFSDFAALDDRDPAALRFVAVEDWLNEGRDLPVALAKECLEEWCRDNRPASGTWRVGDTVVQPSRISVPSLFIAAGRDKLVSPASARKLCDALPRARWHESTTGHIGLIAGERAVEDVWHPLSDWLSESL